MMCKTPLMSTIASIVFLLGMPVDRAIAQMRHEGMHSTTADQTGQFQQLEQPLWIKAALTAGGLGLIGLELWWFMLSKPKSHQATAKEGVLENRNLKD
jgi:plastocyanin domain-containing protein